MSEENSVPTMADLDIVNPIDCASVYVEELGRWFDFDYTSTREPNGETVLDPGRFDPEHPTHADQPFMTGHWIRRGA